MGFAGYVMENVKGIQLYYIIGLLIFMTLFLIILIRTILMPKEVLVEYKTTLFEKDELASYQE